MEAGTMTPPGELDAKSPEDLNDEERAALAAADAAGETAEEPAGTDPEPEPGELVIEGAGQLSFGIGGKKPTSSSLRVVGGKIDVEGQFEKGETIVVEVELRVGEISFVDKTDSATGQTVGCERRHKARIVGIHQ